MDDEKLILLVQENECLYNKYSAGYKIPEKKRDIWRQISAEMKYPEELCQKRWTCLRDRFVKERRQENCPSGSGAKNVSHWPLMKSMEFIAPYVVSRPMRCSLNICKETPDVNSQSSSQSPLSLLSPASVPSPICMSPPLLQTCVDTSFETVSPAPSRGKRKRPAAEENSEDKHFCQALDAFTKLCESKVEKPEEEDTLAGFGKMIVGTIRTMSQKKQIVAMQRVTSLVMEMKLEPDE